MPEPPDYEHASSINSINSSSRNCVDLDGTEIVKTCQSCRMPVCRACKFHFGDLIKSDTSEAPRFEDEQRPLRSVSPEDEHEFRYSLGQVPASSKDRLCSCPTTGVLPPGVPGVDQKMALRIKTLWWCLDAGEFMRQIRPRDQYELLLNILSSQFLLQYAQQPEQFEALRFKGLCVNAAELANYHEATSAREPCQCEIVDWLSRENWFCHSCGQGKLAAMDVQAREIYEDGWPMPYGVAHKKIRRTLKPPCAGQEGHRRVHVCTWCKSIYRGTHNARAIFKIMGMIRKGTSDD
ncbi:hypothetical protein KVT40_006352 [Elsinoe batatas]|uniref:Uncharacterized protein n=1 Tax=Elsinoe batatas TaxID=2601811 RepID=A0A8K0PDQ2_9PEZI|nr:hypothetical protein KVT40_006352 [Elsinoe batatas]